MVAIQNLTYSYPGNQAPVIANLSLEFGPGKIYGLLGANGTGKSTLLYLLSGLLKPQSGTATFNGIATFRRLPSVLSDMFIVAEEFQMPPIRLTEFVEQNAPFYPNFSQEKLEAYLTHFRLTADIHLGRLSMGQRKKAFIAFALACNTSVILMDEPTNGLDIPGKSEFRRAIVDAMTDDRTIIISTHQVRDLDRVLDHVVMIRREGLILDASLRQVQERFQFLFTADPSAIGNALWSEPTAGGYNIIRQRLEGMEETDVNLESLFEFAYSNPLMINLK